MATGTFLPVLVLTPLSVVWAWPSMVSAVLLILSLVILFFVGQTMKAMQGKGTLLLTGDIEARSEQELLERASQALVGGRVALVHDDHLRVLVAKQELQQAVLDPHGLGDLAGSDWGGFDADERGRGRAGAGGCG